jgi:hypothetical protein
MIRLTMILCVVAGFSLVVAAQAQRTNTRARPPQFTPLLDQATAAKLTTGLNATGKSQDGDYRLATTDGFTLHVRATKGRERRLQ